MNLEQILDQLWVDPAFRKCVKDTQWRRIPARPARYADFPSTLDHRLAEVLRQRGIERLYTHQASAIEAIAAGKNVVVVTPTASGKTLCYNLPVLDAILKDDSACAMYLFPTKALSQDQMEELHGTITALGADVKTFTYDGDTPVSARGKIRKAGHIVVTNPDMLHTGILPHHTRWTRLFENLRYVVIDEVHTYRGVFGSHLANVIRRLRRICEFYGSRPQFICCSATIANPDELAGRLIEQPVELVNNNGAPAGEKHFIFYNPPVVNRELGIRRGAILSAREIARNFLVNDIQTIVFARSRVLTEVLLTYLREDAVKHRIAPESVRGYRGGYLPLQRREIEHGLRTGEVRAVVSTNALELGVDIGQLDACVMAGYSGTVASTLQQAGRAGRRETVSAAVLVASSSPLDQFVVSNPNYFFEASPENGLVNPDNLYILMSHLKCAAFELPFDDSERFGVATTDRLLESLEEERVLRHARGRWYWSAESFPAQSVSLRTASIENFVIVDVTADNRVIGEMDRFSVPTLLHEDAIYIHEGRQYHVDRLDFEEQKAYVRQVDVDYYTDADLAVRLAELDTLAADAQPGCVRSHGEVSVTAVATIFKKIKLNTHENVGWGRINLPEETMHTTAYWLSVPDAVVVRYPGDQMQGALVGLANLLTNVAPVYLMCDPRDLSTVCQVRSIINGMPTIYMYDRYPGGIGFSPRIYDLHPELLRSAKELLIRCPCLRGCPSCVGPAAEEREQMKAVTLRLLDDIGA